jgi:uncharacterized protein (TIRG00374 family)
MSKRFLSILNYFIFLGGGLFLVWWQLKTMTVTEKNEFYDSLQSANYWIVIPIAMMSILSHLSRSMRWKLLMEPLGYQPKLSNIFSVTMIGYLANAAVPRLGELLKCTFLAKYEKLKVDKLVGTIILERSFDFICYIIFIFITILIQIDTVTSFITKELDQISAKPGIPIWMKFGILVIAILLIISLLKWLFKKFPENKIISKTVEFVNGIWIGFQSIKHLKKRKAFILHTLFIWSMYLGQVYLGFWGMEATEDLSIKAAFSVLTLTTLSMIVTPGGIGSFPIFVMQTLLIYGIDAPVGKAFGWIMWGVSTSLIIIIGLICLLLIPYLNKDKNEINSIH